MGRDLEAWRIVFVNCEIVFVAKFVTGQNCSIRMQWRKDIRR